MFVVYEEGGSEQHARGCDCGERVEEIRRTRLEYPRRGKRKRGGCRGENNDEAKNQWSDDGSRRTATALILSVWEIERAHWAGPAGRSWYGKSAVNARNIRKSRVLFMPEALNTMELIVSVSSI